MMFEAFLNDRRTRPARARLWGYLASLAVHGPPVAVFVAAWLTHAVVIGSSREPAELRHASRHRIIPILMWSTTRGIGGQPGGGPAVMAQAETGRTGVAAAAGQRPTVRPTQIQPSPADGTPRDYAFDGFTGSEDVDDEEAKDPVDGFGSAIAGLSIGEAGAGTGAGLGASGTGPGASEGEKAAGGLVEEEPEPPRRPAKPKPEAAADKGNGPATEGDGAGDGATPGGGEEPAGAPPGARPVKAALVSAQVGAYFRTHETYPKLPDWCYDGGQTRHSILFEVCVGTNGDVSNVKVKQGTLPEVNEIISTAILSWRYRPRVVAGTARPFCHPIRIEYSRQLRSFVQ